MFNYSPLLKIDNSIYYNGHLLFLTLFFFSSILKDQRYLIGYFFLIISLFTLQQTYIAVFPVLLFGIILISSYTLFSNYLYSIATQIKSFFAGNIITLIITIQIFIILYFLELGTSILIDFFNRPFQLILVLWLIISYSRILPYNAYVLDQVISDSRKRFLEFPHFPYIFRSWSNKYFLYFYKEDEPKLIEGLKSYKTKSDPFFDSNLLRRLSGLLIFMAWIYALLGLLKYTHYSTLPVLNIIGLISIFQICFMYFLMKLKYKCRLQIRDNDWSNPLLIGQNDGG